jgi:hypothetical protein
LLILVCTLPNCLWFSVFRYYYVLSSNSSGC